MGILRRIDCQNFTSIQWRSAVSVPTVNEVNKNPTFMVPKACCHHLRYWRRCFEFLCRGTWWMFPVHGCFFRFGCHVTEQCSLPCNNVLQKLLLFVGVTCQTYEIKTHRTCLVIICVWWSSVRRNQRSHFSVFQLAVDNGPTVRSTQRNVKQSGEVSHLNASVFCNSCTRKTHALQSWVTPWPLLALKPRPAVTENTEPETRLCYHDTTRATYTSTHDNGLPRCNTGLAQKNRCSSWPSLYKLILRHSEMLTGTFEAYRQCRWSARAPYMLQ